LKVPVIEDFDFKYQVKEKQIINYEKVLTNLDEEHMKLSQRVGLLSNPMYGLELQQKIGEGAKTLSLLKREKKRLEDEQKNGNKRMEGILNI